MAETLRRGAEALRVFKQLSAQSAASSSSATPLTVVPMPPTPATPHVVRRSGNAVPAGAMTTGTRSTATDCDFVDLTDGDRPVLTAPSTNPSVYRAMQVRPRPTRQYAKVGGWFSCLTSLR